MFIYVCAKGRLALAGEFSFLLGFFDSFFKEQVSKWTLSAAITILSYSLSEESVQTLNDLSTLDRTEPEAEETGIKKATTDVKEAGGKLKESALQKGNIDTHPYFWAYRLHLAWLLIYFLLDLPISFLLLCVLCWKTVTVSLVITIWVIDHTNVQVNCNQKGWGKRGLKPGNVFQWWNALPSCLKIVLFMIYIYRSQAIT